MSEDHRSNEAIAQVEAIEKEVREHLGAAAGRATQSNDWVAKVPKELHDVANNNSSRAPGALQNSANKMRRLLERPLGLEHGLLVEVLRDPLEPATRTTRRNLDLAAATTIVGACFAKGDIVLLGLHAPVGAALAGVATALIGYHVGAFLIYVRADRSKLSRARAGARAYVVSVRAALEGLRKLADLAERTPHVNEGAAQALRSWVGDQEKALKAFEGDVVRAGIREFWDLALPILLGTVGIAAVWARGLRLWEGFSQ